MQLMALDKDFVQIGFLSTYFDLMWDRKYYETGKFLVQILARDYNPDMVYIYSKDRPETGIIECVSYSDDGSLLTLSGHFAEKILDDKIVYPEFNKTDNISNLCRDIVNTYKEDIHNLVLGEYVDEGEQISTQITGDCLDKAIYSMLKTEEKSYRMRYAYEEDKLYFDIWKGKDRTQTQSDNNFITFSRGFKNLVNVSSKDDNSNYKNYFVIGGTGEDKERIYIELDLSNGQYKKKKYIDAKNMKFNSKKQSKDEYLESLRQKGREKASDYVDIHNVEFDVVESGFRYMSDYDLGDKCDVVIEDIRKSYEARIIEVCEVFKHNKHTITLTFGDKIPTKYERARVR